ncbi:MAG TPA: M56 family metallopeptidase, partial [Pirellulales bacterium]|nr:M56 family metallopeptidase [Pirellulales bacterium]
MTVGIATLSFSPWPRWRTSTEIWQAAQPSDAAAKAPSNPTGRSSFIPSPTAGAASDAASAPAGSSPTANLFGLLSGIWDRVQSQVQNQLDVDSRPEHDARAWRWPAWLAAAMAASTGVGLLRMLAGLLALNRLLRDTRRVTDSSLVALLEELCAKLGCRRPIELREMISGRAGGSPAVVGWLRPAILLPADWRSWSAEVRRGILAHETSHVAHGDYLKWLAAQVAVILHFYNPLVHWLARRLRLEQELAADACGAALAGGPKAYAAVLAQMALR